jgi:hypothetical protein
MARLSLVIFALLIASISAGGVFKGSDSNFKSAVLGSGKNAFVKFLAPW